MRALALGLLAGCSQTAEVACPNVVVIVADDMGYRDLSCYGGTDVSTPHIDSLAEDGVRLTNGYVSAPVCAPTRGGLMTGRYQARFGYESYTGSIEKQLERGNGVSTDELLLPELMRRAGYRTAAVGKWHLGLSDEFHPNRRGVEHFFGFLSGGHDYFIWDEPPQGPQGGPILRNGDAVDGEGYLTEAFTREAVEFIEAEDERPFFLYLAYLNPHVPYQAPEEYRPEPSGDLRRDMVVALVNALDRAVGDVLAALDRAGVADDTLVIFVNDNGSPHPAMNAPFSGAKGSLSEGAVRVPFLVRWPGRVPAGASYPGTAVQLDIVPTCVAAAGAELPGDRDYDGVDLVPFLAGAREGSPHEELFWRFNGMKAARIGDLKLAVDVEGQASLYDLASDAIEAQDLATERPGDVERLRARLADWETRVAR